MWASSQDRGIGKQSSPPCTTTAKITTKIQNNYHHESAENRALWKSDNQGIKEVTFTQMDRRGRDVEMHRDTEMWNRQSHPQVHA